MTTFASSFSTPGTPDRDLVGSTGAELARLVQLGLPVPPGFTVTTAASRRIGADGSWPPGMEGDVARLLAQVEDETGRALGDAQRPLFLAVRPGATPSATGGASPVLDIGFNDATVVALAGATGDERFAWDGYRRLVRMFGEAVLGVPPEQFDAVVAATLAERGASAPEALDVAGLRTLVERGNEVCRGVGGRTVPQDPREQLHLAIDAALAPSAARLGVRTVEVQAMVFGNRGERSGSGRAFTRDPATGDLGDFGVYRTRAQGVDIVPGDPAPVALGSLREIDPTSYRRLRSIMGTLERHHRDLCFIDFTIERGRLWILGAGIGERTPRAAFRVAVDLVDEGMITEDEALVRVTGEQLEAVTAPPSDDAVADPLLDRAVARLLAHADRVVQGASGSAGPVDRLEAARALLLADGCSAERFDEADAPMLTTAG